jgi:hypothetical protein
MPLPVTQSTPLPNNTNILVGGDENDIDDIDYIKVILDPELDEDLLKTYVNSARKIIMDMYIECEQDFLEGIHIFESIIARKLGQTTTNQINKLNETVLQIYTNREETYT